VTKANKRQSTEGLSITGYRSQSNFIRRSNRRKRASLRRSFHIGSALRKWPAAEADFRRATELDPSYSLVHLILAHLLSQTGRHAEAEPFTRRARELNPLDPLSYALSSQVAFQASDYAAALQHANRAIALDQEFWIGHQMRGQALEQLGDDDLALKALATAARLSGQNSKPISLTGYILGRSGRTAEARDVLGALDMASRQRYEKIKPIVAGRMPLVEARRAHENLGRGGVVGKQILVRDEEAAS